MALFPRFSTLPPAKVANLAKVEMGTPGRDQNFRNFRSFSNPTESTMRKGTAASNDRLIDILERAAVLEICSGLQRANADEQALREFGFASWEAVLAARRGIFRTTGHRQKRIMKNRIPPRPARDAGDPRHSELLVT